MKKNFVVFIHAKHWCVRWYEFRTAMHGGPIIIQTVTNCKFGYHIENDFKLLILQQFLLVEYTAYTSEPKTHQNTYLTGNIHAVTVVPDMAWNHTLPSDTPLLLAYDMNNEALPSLAFSWHFRSPTVGKRGTWQFSRQVARCCLILRLWSINSNVTGVQATIIIIMSNAPRVCTSVLFMPRCSYYSSIPAWLECNFLYCKR